MLEKLRKSKISGFSAFIVIDCKKMMCGYLHLSFDDRSGANDH